MKPGSAKKTRRTAAPVAPPPEEDLLEGLVDPGVPALEDEHVDPPAIPALEEHAELADPALVAGGSVEEEPSHDP